MFQNLENAFTSLSEKVFGLAQNDFCGQNVLKAFYFQYPTKPDKSIFFNLVASDVLYYKILLTNQFLQNNRRKR